MIRAVDFSTFDLPSVLLEESAAAELHAHGSVAAAVLVPMTRWPERPTLTFTDAEMAERIAALAAGGFEFARRPPGNLDAARHALLVAPEGTQLLLATVE